MRILAVSAWDPVRLSDGASLVLHHHLHHLAEDHEIRVVTADREAPEPGAILPPSIRVERVPVTVPRALDGPARRLWALATGEPPHVRWVERRRLVARLDDHVATWRPDVLWLFGWGTARLARVAPGIPAVHTAVDPWSRNHEVRDLRGWRAWGELGDGSRIRRHEERHLPALAAVVVVAAPDADHLAERVGARVVVVPNGVEPGPPPAAPPGRPVVGFHGNLAATPNVDAARWLVEVLAPALRRHRDDVEVRLVGRDPPDELVAAAREDVVVTGSVPDVRPELDRMAVYVAPMRRGAGMKNKILEAMAAGRPVVTTPLGAQGIGEGPGLVVVPLERIADEVAALLADAPRATAIGAAGRARVERDFTWAASGARMARVFEEVVRDG